MRQNINDYVRKIGFGTTAGAKHDKKAVVIKIESSLIGRCLGRASEGMILTRIANVVGNQIIYKYGFLIEPATIDNIHNFQSSISLARRSDEETFRLSTPI